MKRYIPSDLKNMNRRTVYNMIASTEGIFRAEISRKTGISSPTVIKIIDHFINLGIATMEGEGVSRIGRKPQIIRFNPNAAYTIGIEFTGPQLCIGIVNLIGEIISIKSFPCKPDFLFMLKRDITKYVNKVIDDLRIERQKILGMGIGIPGSVDPITKIITLAPSLGIQGKLNIFDLIIELEKKLGLPIILERDVYASAIGEFAHRKNGESKDLLFVFLGSGAGAGLILDGKLRRGEVNLAGEIGYLCFDIRQKLDTSSLGWFEKSIIEATQLYKRDYEKATSLVSDQLTIAISALSISLDIGEIILGGPSAKTLGPPLYDRVNSKLSSRCLRKTQVSFPTCDYPILAGLGHLITENKIGQLIEN